LIGLTGFETEDGRSDGSDRQERFLVAGSSTQVGRLEDLLHATGYAYLVQIAASEPRGVTFDLMTALDPAFALRGPDLAAVTADMPLSVVPGELHLLDLAEAVELPLTAPGDRPFRFEVIAPPGAVYGRDMLGMTPWPEGIFPLGPFDRVPLVLNPEPRRNETSQLLVLRSTALDPAVAYDEVEPGNTRLGPLPPEGLSLTGVLLAHSDKDVFEFALDVPVALDFGVQFERSARGYVALRRDGAEVLCTEISGETLYRPGLVLEPGAYEIEISGQQDHPLD
jgi:hypothetical protein